MDFGKTKTHKMFFNPLLPTNAGKKQYNVNICQSYTTETSCNIERKMRAIGDSNPYKPIEKCSFINSLYSVPKKV